MLKYILIIFFSIVSFNAMSQQTIIGRVVSDEESKPLNGASIRVKGRTAGASTDLSGEFSLKAYLSDTLLITYAGYLPQQMIPPLKSPLIVRLQRSANELSEVVISTGYQSLPKERVTGSFVQVDNKLLNRSVGTNIIDRLRDVVPGLSFNTVGSSRISVRGQSTIYGNAEPLIVLDNFPYEGNLLDIHPNDIESITVLKDAAAASIWGARAGNGVIVITSKRGRQRTPAQVALNTNLTVTGIPDLYSDNRLSSADYIDIEKRLFEDGYYEAALLSGYQPLTPVIELLYKKKNNPSEAETIDRQIEDLKLIDVRKDFRRYFYQTRIDQQFTLGLNGGADNHSYYLSAGYDRNRENLIRNSYSRVTINAGNTYSLLKNKIHLTAGVSFINNREQNNNTGTSTITNATAGNSIYPYAQLADEHGTPLTVVKNYSTSFISGAESDGLLDWSYSPIAEVYLADNTNKRTNTRLNSEIKYTLLDGLSTSLLYQYTNIAATGRNFRSQDTYFSRDLINRYTQVNGATIERPVPFGGILDMSEQSSVNHTFRTQVDFRKNFAGNHEVNAIAGFEVRDTRTENRDYRYYGYDEEYAQSGLVDYTDNTLPLYYDSSRRGQIPNVDGTVLLNDRYRSWYANASYTYNARITLSASARLDQSNLFGVRTNQKGVPLWSGGISWQISKENFYNMPALPYLNLRLTYGYNGSVNKSVSAYTTASLTGYYNYDLPYATIINPPNPELRWERVKIVNTGIDFGMPGNRITGSIEYYHKQGVDLIGDTPFPPSSGVSLFRGNVANTSGDGVDLNLGGRILEGNRLSWRTDLLFSYVKERVTKYLAASTATSYIQSGLHIPLEGKPLYSLYSYRWAGLDPQNGDPMGFLNGEISKEYTDIIASVTPEDMLFSGSLRPASFGAIRNTVIYDSWSLSFNISYRFGYFFRKTSVNYGNNYGLLSNNGDYALRWRKAGDEILTSVPSVPVLANANRDAFYRYSEALIGHGDNIRMQDVRLSYDYKLKSESRFPFQSFQLYAFISNIGILWKKTGLDIDPDSPSGKTPLAFSLGLNVKL